MSSCESHGSQTQAHELPTGEEPAVEAPTILSAALSVTDFTEADVSAASGWPKDMISELFAGSTDSDLQHSSNRTGWSAGAQPLGLLPGFHRWTQGAACEQRPPPVRLLATHLNARKYLECAFLFQSAESTSTDAVACGWCTIPAVTCAAGIRRRWWLGTVCAQFASFGMG